MTALNFGSWSLSRPVIKLSFGQSTGKYHELKSLARASSFVDELKSIFLSVTGDRDDLSLKISSRSVALKRRHYEDLKL